jgi:hypothetical protein
MLEPEFELEISDTDLGADAFAAVAIGTFNFVSIPHSFWYSLVSITTCGYGDEVPETIFGCVVGGMAMCTGILIIALPVGVVGAKFQEAYGAYERDKAIQHYSRMKHSALPGSSPETTANADAGVPTPIVPTAGSDPDAIMPYAGDTASPVREKDRVVSSNSAGSGEPPSSRPPTPPQPRMFEDTPDVDFPPLQAWLDKVGIHSLDLNRATQDHVAALVKTYEELVRVHHEESRAQRDYTMIQQELGQEFSLLVRTSAT